MGELLTGTIEGFYATEVPTSEPSVRQPSQIFKFFKEISCHHGILVPELGQLLIIRTEYLGFRTGSKIDEASLAVDEALSEWQISF